MKQLEKTLKRKGTVYKLVKREGNVALYEQFYELGLGTKKSLTPSIGFEVFVVKRHNGFKAPNGIVVPPGEMMPLDGDFGKTAFTYCDRKNANKKFDELIKTGGKVEKKTSTVNVSAIVNKKAKRKDGKPMVEGNTIRLNDHLTIKCYGMTPMILKDGKVSSPVKPYLAHAMKLLTTIHDDEIQTMTMKQMVQKLFGVK